MNLYTPLLLKKQVVESLSEKCCDLLNLIIGNIIIRTDTGYHRLIVTLQCAIIDFRIGSKS